MRERRNNHESLKPLFHESLIKSTIINALLDKQINNTTTSSIQDNLDDQLSNSCESSNSSNSMSESKESTQSQLFYYSNDVFEEVKLLKLLIFYF